MRRAGLPWPGYTRIMDWSSALPPLHAAWMAQVVEGEISGESRSGCDDCAMCDKGRAPGEGRGPAAELTLPGPSEGFFADSTKCCTYLPELANFLVGAALLEPDSPGRRGVVERIGASSAVTPMGLGKTLEFKAAYQPEAFGRQTDLRCPHYLPGDGGKCGVWLHRNAICATYFCHFDRGAVGKRFWAATNRFLKTVERGLARWCLQQLEPGPVALARLVNAPDDALEQAISEGDPAALQALWGPWWGKPSEYFEACARLVGDLTAAQALALSGPQAELAGKLVAEAHAQRLSGEIPDPLVRAQVKAAGQVGDRIRLEAYSPLDPVELPLALWEALACFDGRRTNAQALSAVSSERGVAISADLLRRLFEVGLLERASSPQQAIADALAAIRALKG